MVRSTVSHHPTLTECPSRFTVAARSKGRRVARGTCLVALLAVTNLHAREQKRTATPIRQSELTTAAERPVALTLEEASRNDRWLGLGVRDVRWAPDGSAVYFRWNVDPEPGDVPASDPWFRSDPAGSWVETVSDEDVATIPGRAVVWGTALRRAVWIRDGAVFLYDSGADPYVRRLVALPEPAHRVRLSDRDRAIDFEAGEALYRYVIDQGSLTVLALKVAVDPAEPTEATQWLADQQRELFALVRERAATEEAAAQAARASGGSPQKLPVPAATVVDQIQRSPDGRWITFRARTPSSRTPPTEYIDYVDDTGYSNVLEARPKVGEPRDVLRLAVLPHDPTVAVDALSPRWLELPEAGDQNTVPHGPFWNLEGTRAVAVFVGEHHRDVWIAELDPATGNTSIVAHDHDDAWIGGPPVQANYLGAPLLEWLSGDRFVFASERSGFSHLYLVERSGEVRPLTSGEWEVRGAELSRDRKTWLLQASREHPADDQLYVMPAAGGELTPLTDAPGRHVGHLSPDGDRVAIELGDSVSMPDLFVGAAAEGSERRRVTVSGTDHYFEHPLVRPSIVSFPHPDGEPLWAALFAPESPNAERAAIIHFHGGGYRQFAHRGWTVYGWALHLGFINWAVQRGYTVLDFDYRGSAGFGRDYRTDISRSMGIQDVDGAKAAADYLVAEAGIDASRIGVYGVSYGGFMTLMSLFRYPGVFAAGIARASVTDWAHYSDGWTSRILGVPHEDPEAYRRSSPIYYADGLADPLLITHGLVDDNVHFQDSARLAQKLIELGKDFEMMVYPGEPHTIQTESARLDYLRRAAEFFERHLLR